MGRGRADVQKNAFELMELRAVEISTASKNHIVQRWRRGGGGGGGGGAIGQPGSTWQVGRETNLITVMLHWIANGCLERTPCLVTWIWSRLKWSSYFNLFAMSMKLLGLFTKKTLSYQYRDSHYKPETVVRPPWVYNGDPYTRKTASF